MITNLAAHKLFKDSIFATQEFKALDIHGQASMILEHEDLLDAFGQEAMEQLSTILIKAMCTCTFLEFVPDEITGADNIFVGRKHAPSCPVVRIPVIEDLSTSQISRRQKRELLCDHKHLVIIEETSAQVKKKAKKHVD